MSAYSSLILADSPVCYYRFDEASGTTMADSSGNARDGVYTSVTLGAPSLVADSDAALQLTGTGYAQVPYGAWMNTSPGFTAEAWVKTSAQGAILDRDGYNSYSRGWQWVLGGGGALTFTKISNGVTAVASTQSVTDGKAHHVAVTYDGSNIVLYIDGLRVKSSAASGALTGTSPLTVGSNYEPTSGGYLQTFNGILDEAAIYATVLTDAKIAAHYAAGNALSGVWGWVA